MLDMSEAFCFFGIHGKFNENQSKLLLNVRWLEIFLQTTRIFVTENIHENLPGKFNFPGILFNSFSL